MSVNHGQSDDNNNNNNNNDDDDPYAYLKTIRYELVADCFEQVDRLMCELINQHKLDFNESGLLMFHVFEKILRTRECYLSAFVHMKEHERQQTTIHNDNNNDDDKKDGIA